MAGQTKLFLLYFLFKYVLHCYIFQAMQNSCRFVATCVVQAGHSRQHRGLTTRDFAGLKPLWVFIPLAASDVGRLWRTRRGMAKQQTTAHDTGQRGQTQLKGHHGKNYSIMSLSATLDGRTL